MTATPLDISSLLSNPQVGAILHAGQPALAALGLGTVLYGLKSPAGRMVQTVYPAAFATTVSPFDMNMRPGPSAWPAPGCPKPAGQCPNATNPGRTYRFYTGQPVVPFGLGLSYTTFTYALRRASPAAAIVDLGSLRALLTAAREDGRSFLPHGQLAAEAPLIKYEVDVTNTGSLDADDVVLGFISPPSAGKGGVPLKSLFGFERVHVPAGQTVTVFLYPALADFSTVDVGGERLAQAGEYTVSFGVRETASRMGFLEHRVTAI